MILLLEQLASPRMPLEPSLSATLSCELKPTEPRGGQLPAKTSSVQLSVLIVFHGESRTLIDSVLALVRHAEEVDSLEIFVVDMASTKTEMEVVRRFVKHITPHLGVQIRLIEFDHDIDPYVSSAPVALSTAAQIAKGPLLLVIGCEGLVHANALRAMVGLFDTHPDVGMAVPKLLQPTGEVPRSGNVVVWTACPLGGLPFQKSASSPAVA